MVEKSTIKRSVRSKRILVEKKRLLTMNRKNYSQLAIKFSSSIVDNFFDVDCHSPFPKRDCLQW